MQPLRRAVDEEESSWAEVLELVSEYSGKVLSWHFFAESGLGGAHYDVSGIHRACRMDRARGSD